MNWEGEGRLAGDWEERTDGETSVGMQNQKNKEKYFKIHIFK